MEETLTFTEEFDDNYHNQSRLPTNIIPEHYQLEICPDLNEFKFSGHVEIHLQSSNKVNEIILNAVDLKITGGFVEDLTGHKICFNRIIYNSKNQIIALRFHEGVEVQPRRLFLNFSGILNNSLQGFYRSSFVLQGKEIYAATTHFEPTHARRAFPCFDEPSLKATFDIAIIYDHNSISVGDKILTPVALSNGQVISEEKLNDKSTKVKFETTPKMSTYLLAFIVGPFEFVERQLDSRGCRIRVYATPSKKEQGHFALDLACRSIQFYERYFAIEYPLAKMDLIAIPDFPIGAMENWGLITFRERCLLVDEEKTSTSLRQNIAIIVTHEIAHQWFGNLVTMVWWNDLWLKEGFATFMSYVCTSEFFRQWDLWSQYATGVLCPALIKDSLHNTHPIEVPVHEATEIGQIFDEISYEKGSSVIRMLNDFVGDDMFRKGLTNYLEKFAYKNAVTEDLWNSIEEVSQKPITTMMSLWTKREGYPWIRVEIAANTVDDGHLTVDMHQQRFIADGRLPVNDNNSPWNVPISIISGSTDIKPISALLSKPTESFIVVNKRDEWIKLNRNYVGFYRTAYEPLLLNRLADRLKLDLNPNGDSQVDQCLTPLDRLALLNDYLAFCRAGYVNTGELLRILCCFKNEFDLTVWESIDECVAALSNLYRNSKEYKELFRQYVIKLYSKISAKYLCDNYTDESHADSILRAVVFQRMIQCESEHAKDMAKKLYKKQMEMENQQIHPDLRYPVYLGVSRFGDDEQFESLFTLYDNDDSHEEKARIMRALCSTTVPNRVGKIIEFIKSDKIRAQDMMSCVVPLAQTDIEVGWKFFTENTDFLREKCSTDILKSRVIFNMFQHSHSESMAIKIEKYFEQNKFPGADRAIVQLQEVIRINAGWLQRHSIDPIVEDILINGFN